MMIMGHRWNDTGRGKPKGSEKILSNAALSTTYPTWTDLGLKPGLLDPSEPWYGQIVTVGTILSVSCSAHNSQYLQ